MNTRDQGVIPDVQSSADKRKIAINKVGVKAIRHPVRVSERGGGVQHTIAMFNMYVGLPHQFKGTHMSRFVELLERPRAALSLPDLRQMFAEMLLHLQANSGRI